MRDHYYIWIMSIGGTYESNELNLAIQTQLFHLTGSDNKNDQSLL
jgi:hypothetical protein